MSQAQRLLALAEIYDGHRRSDAAHLARVGLQIIRDWVVRFNAEGPGRLFNRKGSGPPSCLDDAQRVTLRRAVEEGPNPYLDGVVRWRLVDLVQWMREEFGVSVSPELHREVQHPLTRCDNGWLSRSRGMLPWEGAAQPPLTF